MVNTLPNSERRPSPERSSFHAPLLRRHAEISAVLRDERFGYPEPPPPGSSWRQRTRENGNHFVQLIPKLIELPHLWFLFRNPPDHTRLRSLVQPAFDAVAVESWRPTIEHQANALLDRMQDTGQMDLVADFATPLSVSLISQLLNLPATDQRMLEQASRALAHVFDPGGLQLGHGPTLLALLGLTHYFRELIDERSNHLGEDLISSLIRNQRAGKLHDDELLAMCSLLLLAGSITTRHMIGNAMLALLRHPDQLRLLQSNSTLLKKAVEELLRYETSAQFAGRMALQDVQLGERTLRKGQWVYLLLSEGNKDPQKFPEPERLDITRTPNPHLSFGLGRHHCLGARLGRTTLQIAIGTLLRRLPHLALSEEPSKPDTTYNLHGLSSLPVLF